MFLQCTSASIICYDTEDGWYLKFLMVALVGCICYYTVVMVMNLQVTYLMKFVLDR